MRVAERGILDVNLPHDAHLYLLFRPAFDLFKALQHKPRKFFIMPVRFRIERLFDDVKTFRARLIRIPFVYLVRLALIIESHQAVPVKNAESEF